MKHLWLLILFSTAGIGLAQSKNVLNLRVAADTPGRLGANSVEVAAYGPNDRIKVEVWIDNMDFTLSSV